MRPIASVFIIVGSVAVSKALTGQLGKGRWLALGLIGGVALLCAAVALLVKFGGPKCPECATPSRLVTTSNPNLFRCPACGHQWPTA